MARVRRGGFRGGSLRRKTAWNVGCASGATAGAAQPLATTASLLMTQGAVILVDGVTLIRLRGYLRLYLSLATASNDGFFGAFGIGVVPGGERGFVGVGGGALPIPVTNQDDETWIYHQYFSVVAPFPFASAADPAGNRSSDFIIQIDSKAMRKMNIGDILYASIEATEVGTANMQIHFDSRTLFKLS